MIAISSERALQFCQQRPTSWGTHAAAARDAMVLFSYEGRGREVTRRRRESPRRTSPAK